MKSKLSYYFSVILFFLTLSVPVYAQILNANEQEGRGLGSAFGTMLRKAGGAANFNIDNSNLFNEILSSVIFTVLSLLGTIFLILLIYAGIRWMTAGGREEVLNKAKDTIKQAIIGLLIVTGAYAISSFFFWAWQLAGN